MLILLINYKNFNLTISDSLVTVDRPVRPVQIIVFEMPNNFLPVLVVVAGPELAHPERGRVGVTGYLDEPLSKEKERLEQFVGEVRIRSVEGIKVAGVNKLFLKKIFTYDNRILNG